MRKGSWLLFVVLVLLLGVPAYATEINGAATGLTSPVSTIDFSEISLTANSALTTQYASLGITFGPNVYYDPQICCGMPANDVGNFTFPTEPSYVDPVTITFSTALTSADFLMTADNTPYLFQAYDGSTLVDSFTGTVSGSAAFYGFSNEAFNEIVITQSGTGSGPYWLASDVQLGTAAVTSTPEPGSLLLLASGGLPLLGFLRRRKQNLA